MAVAPKENFTLRLDPRTIEQLERMAEERGVRTRTLAQQALEFFVGALPPRAC